MDDVSLADRVDAVLPQTQCTRCGYDGCRPYAEAIAGGRAGIDRCPPGGAAGVVLLASVTGRPVVPLDPACGPEQPLRLAAIDESVCIGCAKCIEACPVDAIVGARRLMHTVVAELCTGCELCVAPCPVDCIAMLQPEPPRPWRPEDARAARARHDARRARRRRAQQAREPAPVPANAPGPAAAAPAAPAAAAAPTAAPDPAAARRRALVEAALARARLRSGAGGPRDAEP